MAILAFLIGTILILGGLGSLALSVNLVPTEMGLLYAVCGAILVSGGGVATAVAAMIARLDRIVAPSKKSGRAEQFTPPAPEAPDVASVAPAPPALAEPPEDEINLNRRGHLPSLIAVEQALAEPEATPQVVGRYSAGGAKYMIFSDGAIEAETEEGAFRFASMGEFKSYLAGRKP